MLRALRAPEIDSGDAKGARDIKFYGAGPLRIRNVSFEVADVVLYYNSREAMELVGRMWVF